MLNFECKDQSENEVKSDGLSTQKETSFERCSFNGRQTKEVEIGCKQDQLKQAGKAPRCDSCLQI